MNKANQAEQKLSMGGECPICATENDELIFIKCNQCINKICLDCFNHMIDLNTDSDEEFDEDNYNPVKTSYSCPFCRNQNTNRMKERKSINNFETVIKRNYRKIDQLKDEERRQRRFIELDEIDYKNNIQYLMYDFNDYIKSLENSRKNMLNDYEKQSREIYDDNDEFFEDLKNLYINELQQIKEKEEQKNEEQINNMTPEERTKFILNYINKLSKELYFADCEKSRTVFKCLENDYINELKKFFDKYIENLSCLTTKIDGYNTNFLMGFVKAVKKMEICDVIRVYIFRNNIQRIRNLEKIIYLTDIKNLQDNKIYQGINNEFYNELFSYQNFETRCDGHDAEKGEIYYHRDINTRENTFFLISKTTKNYIYGYEMDKTFVEMKYNKDYNLIIHSFEFNEPSDIIKKCKKEGKKLLKFDRDHFLYQLHYNDFYTSTEQKK